MIPATGQPIIQQINDPILQAKGLKLYIKREDLLHPTVSGNKWRKLKYNIAEAKALGHDTVLTFGGAYSNHIYATAAAANGAGLQSIGIIRGERIEPLNDTLCFAEEQGMLLHFVSRSAYREKDTPEFINELPFKNVFIIPEGGSNTLAVKGCAEILDDVDIPMQYVCCAVGTGGTLAGLAVAAEPSTQVLGIAALKGENFLQQEVSQLLSSYGIDQDNWSIRNDYHHGGYAKISDELIAFIQEFKKTHNIPLDPIYTGKMMYAIYDLIKKDYFEAGANILTIHTGGLQGIAGMNKRYGLCLSSE